MKEVSIIVPTINSESDVRVLCESMKRLGLDEKAEFIFVDSCSRDDTRHVLASYNVTVIPLDTIVSKGRARNIGFHNATGNIIVNVDADIEFIEGWFEEVLNTMKYADIAAGYSYIPGGSLPRVGLYVDGQDISYPCCNLVHKREIFEKVGLFDETQGQAEDMELNYRCIQQGYSIVYNPKMKLIHHQRTTKKGWWKQAFWNGEARYELIRLHPELFRKQNQGLSIRGLVRLGVGSLGYAFGRFYRRPGEKVQWKKD
jgi:GT2 family glycosyltransferase